MQKYLEPIYSNQKSFYGKAIIETIDEVTRLYSYATPVAKIEGNHYYCYNTQSQTTRKHIKEFFKQHNLSDKQIKELMKEGSLTIDDEIPLF